MANSEDPDQTAFQEQSDLALHSWSVEKLESITSFSS